MKRISLYLAAAFLAFLTSCGNKENNPQDTLESETAKHEKLPGATTMNDIKDRVMSSQKDQLKKMGLTGEEIKKAMEKSAKLLGSMQSVPVDARLEKLIKDYIVANMKSADRDNIKVFSQFVYNADTNSGNIGAKVTSGKKEYFCSIMVSRRNNDWKIESHIAAPMQMEE
ncbi:MAG: hypothetical protein JW994_02190 [Candidatus Omnitrophica bacterium]|nr:hypothetical protein [Candidatus Omnitrophota bacterium]